MTDQSRLYETYTINAYEFGDADEGQYSMYLTMALINDTAIYELVLKIKNDQVDDKILVSVDQAFNNYGDYKPQKIIKAFDIVATAAFYNDDKNQSVLAFYERDALISLERAEAALEQDTDTIMNPFLGAQVFDYNLEYEQVYKYDLYKDSWNLTHAVVVNPFDSSLLQITFRKSMKVNITSPNLKQQDITIKAISDFSEPTDQFTFTLKRSPNPSPHKKKHLWWISLVVIGGLLIIGAAAFYFIRHRRQRIDKHSDMISLQEPIKAGSSKQYIDMVTN